MNRDRPGDPDRRARNRARREARGQQHDPRPVSDDDWSVPDGTGLRRTRGPEALSDLVRTFADRPEWGERLRSSDLRVRWTEIVGEALADQCEPARLAGGHLTIRVARPVWATQVKAMALLIQERANDVLGEQIVQAVHVTIGSLSGDD